MSRQEKKQKFNQPQKSKTGLYVLLAAAVILIVGGGLYLTRGDAGNPDAALNVGSANFNGQTANFAKVTAAETDGDVVIDLNAVKSQNVTFDVQGVNFSLANGTPFNYLPLLSYVSPKGDVVVAVSLCEPCSGTSFHVEGNELVCNACGTRWTLDGLKGTAGGCQTYPPETLKYTVDGNNLKIKKADLLNWKPRPV